MGSFRKRSPLRPRLGYHFNFPSVIISASLRCQVRIFRRSSGGPSNFPIILANKLGTKQALREKERGHIGPLALAGQS
jgi:hypothetical protein